MMNRMMQLASVFAIVLAVALPGAYLASAPTTASIAAVSVPQPPPGWTCDADNGTCRRTDVPEVTLARAEALVMLDRIADLFGEDDEDEGDEVPATTIDFSDEPMVIIASAATTPNCTAHTCALR